MTITLGTITLPDDLEWTDEFDWTPVEDAIDTALSGSLVIHTGTKAAGRTITLEGNSGQAWISRETMLGIKALADSPPSGLVLDYHGRAFNVRFRYTEKPYSSRPVVFRSGVPDLADWYTVVIRLMEV